MGLLSGIVKYNIFRRVLDAFVGRRRAAGTSTSRRTRY